MACRDDTPVGHAQLAYEWRDGNARLGRVAIAPDARGQGLARPMVALMIDEAFRAPGIERLELNVYMFNTPAIRTYQAPVSYTHLDVYKRQGLALPDLGRGHRLALCI